MGIARKFIQHVVPGVIKPMRVLWNEVIGFVFLALAGLSVPSAIRTTREYDGDAESFFRLLLTGLFIVIMLYFGVTSFLRARKISRT